MASTRERRWREIAESDGRTHARYTHDRKSASFAVAATSEDELVVVGLEEADGGPKAMVVRLDADGSPIFRWRSDAISVARAVAIGPVGEMVVAGWKATERGPRAWLTGLDAQGGVSFLFEDDACDVAGEADPFCESMVEAIAYDPTRTQLAVAGASRSGTKIRPWVRSFTSRGDLVGMRVYDERDGGWAWDVAWNEAGTPLVVGENNGRPWRTNDADSTDAVFQAGLD